MALLIVSQFVAGDPVAYGLLLVATACLGVGFGLTAPTLNILTAVFHPARADTSVLTLNALLGLGTALAPAFVAIFVGLGFWWGLPVLSAVLLTGLLMVSMRLPLRSGAREAGERAGAGAGIPSRFWVFAAFAVLYGVCETMNGNWAQLEMTGQLGASATLASIALTTFWAMVTAGRVLFTRIEQWFPTRDTYHLLPFVLAAALVAIALLPDGTPAPWRARLRAGRPWLLGAVAAHHQLRKILNLLADIRTETGVSYVFISHDLAVVRQVTDDLIVMRDGRTLETGRTARVLDAPRHPYTRLLRASVPGQADAADR